MPEDRPGARRRPPSATSTATLAAAAAEGLTVTHVAETHVHADFLSGARALAEAAGARLALSAEGEGQGWGSEWAHGRDDVTFLRDGDAFRVGNVEVRAVHTPGHTPEHLSFLVTDHGGGADAPMGLVSGDFVFVGDLGRPDLLEQAAGQPGAQEPAARQLFESVGRFLELDDFVQVWPGHGAGSACGKALGAVPQTTVGYERRFNGAIDAARRGEADFVDAILDGQPAPPLYFARMKAQNRAGVPPLAALPTPRAADLAGGLPPGAVVIDTRPDRSAFMAAHLPGSLYAPLGPSFSAVVGSYVTDPGAPVVLVVPEAEAERAVRALVRVGIDRVEATVTYEALAAHVGGGGAVATIPESDFGAVHDRQPGTVVLDVRRAAEVAAGRVPGSVHVPAHPAGGAAGRGARGPAARGPLPERRPRGRRERVPGPTRVPRDLRERGVRALPRGRPRRDGRAGPGRSVTPTTLCAVAGGRVAVARARGPRRHSAADSRCSSSW